jgi:hypothetical protein
MQFAKDSFYAALRERLAAVNPARTIVLNGAERPALVVVENELPNAERWLPDTFYLEWGGIKMMQEAHGVAPIMGMQCMITYFTVGSIECGVNRGRMLGTLDGELLQMCQPCYTEKQDFRQSPSSDVGTGVFWTLPDFQTPTAAGELASHTARLERKANMTVFFFPEETER